MKLKYIIAILMFVCISCSEDVLDDKIYDRLVPGIYFNNDGEAIAAVNSIYGALNGTGWDYYGAGNERIQGVQEATTDIMGSTASSGFMYDLSNFIWKPQDYFLTVNWNGPYKGIAYANYITQYLPDAAGVSETVKKRSIAEAKTGLGLFYKDLVELYGDVPLIKTFAEGKTYPAKTPANEVLNYAIQQLNEAIPDLPPSYSSADNGRFTKGAAYALLCKIYLMQKNWAKVVESATAISGLGYSLDLKGYSDLFIPANQNNPEFILTKQCFPDFNVGNTMPTYSLPADYKLPDGVNIQIWNLYRVRRTFYNSFDAEDTRRNLILESYPNKSGGITTLAPTADVISVKYAPDPGAVIVFGTNDVPLIRLADILLAKAEALNELNGPNEESVNLINAVRDRAFNNNPAKRKSLQDFPSKEDLREWILKERGWELYFEGHRRADLIRHDKFLEKASERGAVDVSEKRIVFPTPQAELDVNKNLVPTPGY